MMPNKFGNSLNNMAILSLAHHTYWGMECGAQEHRSAGAQERKGAREQDHQKCKLILLVNFLSKNMGFRKYHF